MNNGYSNRPFSNVTSFDVELPGFDDLGINIDALPDVLPDVDDMATERYRPSYPGGPQIQPPRPPYPGGPQIQPPRPPYPGGPQIQPPRPPYPGGPQIQPPRPPYPGGPQIQPPRPPFDNNSNNNINICMNRLTFIWDANGETYWYYPTSVSNNTLYGYRWNAQAGWFLYDLPLWQIRRYVCIN